MPEIKSLVTYGGHRAGGTYNVSKALADALVKMKRAQYLTKDMVAAPPAPPVQTPADIPPPPPVAEAPADIPPPPPAVEAPVAPVAAATKSKSKKEDTK